MKINFKIILSSIPVLFLVLFFSLKIYTKNHMPDEFYSAQKEEISIKTFIPFIDFKIKPNSNLVSAKENNYYNCNFTLLGIPLKNI